MGQFERLDLITTEARALQTGNRTLEQVLRRIIERNPGYRRVLLFADQMEELYTYYPYSHETSDPQGFLDTLLAAFRPQLPGRVPDFTLVMTLRADFLQQALSYRPFADALQHADTKLGPMTREELRAVIEGPAAKQKVRIENGLSRRLLDEVSGRPGALPLLQFALTQLWASQRDGQLTHAAYDKIGGVEAALTNYAEEKYGELNSGEKRQSEKIFVQLVRPGDRTQDTRRRATRAEVRDENWSLVRSLAGARLVVTGRDEVTGQETVELVHEALIGGWQRLRDWMVANRKFRTWQERLEPALKQWLADPRDEGALLRGRPLEEARDWLNDRSADLAFKVQEFIQASLRRKSRRTRNRQLAVGGVLIILLTGIIVSSYFWFEARAGFQAAREAVEAMLVKAGAVDLEDVPHMEPVREQLLQEALTFCNGFLKKWPNNGDIRHTKARVEGYLGDIQQMLGEDDRAHVSYSDGITLLEELTRHRHDLKECRRELGRWYNHLGMLMKRNNWFQEAATKFELSIGHRQDQLNDSPDSPEFQRELQASRYNLATVLARTPTGKKVAERTYREVLDEQERLAQSAQDRPEWPNYRQEVARTLNNLAILLANGHTREERDEAEKHFNKAAKIMVELTTKNPSRPGFQWLLARINNDLANKLMDDKDHPMLGVGTVVVMVTRLPSGPFLATSVSVRAELAYLDALKRLMKLASDFPNVPDYKQELADIYYNRGHLELDKGRWKQAQAYFEKARRLRAELAADFGMRPVYRHDLAQVLINVGLLLEKDGQPQQAQEHYWQAWQIMRKLVAAFHHMADYQEDVFRACQFLARLLLSRPDLPGARSLLDEIKADPDLRGRPEFEQFIAALEKVVRSLEAKAKGSPGRIAGSGPNPEAK
jgi:tetratricopeptide (TPR) repeat protein